MKLYPWIFKNFFVKMDPERAHHFAFDAIKLVPKVGLGALVHRFCAPAHDQEVEALGLRFPSPFGLAAGFDKDASGIVALGDIGFGHVEVGTLTAHAQEGNPTPRLFRLVEDRAVINRMGFNNGGSAAAAPRIEQARLVKRRPVIGVNIGKSRITEVADAIGDYVLSAQRLAPIADYLAVNVSSPNTPGLRGLQEIELLAPLLSAVQEAAGDTPLLVKIAPDLADEELDAIADLVTQLGLNGIIATNTTIARSGLQASEDRITEIGAGGLSGAPLKARSLEVLQRLRARVPADLCVISVGGVTTAQDVQERWDAGATLVQGYTAFLYEGPLWARSINRDLRSIATSRGN